VKDHLQQGDGCKGGVVILDTPGNYKKSIRERRGRATRGVMRGASIREKPFMLGLDNSSAPGEVSTIKTPHLDITGPPGERRGKGDSLMILRCKGKTGKRGEFGWTFSLQTRLQLTSQKGLYKTRGEKRYSLPSRKKVP